MIFPAESNLSSPFLYAGITIHEQTEMGAEDIGLLNALRRVLATGLAMVLFLGAP